MKTIKRIVSKFIINHFLPYTRFFLLKRYLLTWAGIKIGENTKVVGPIYFSNAIELTIGKNCWIGKNINFDGNGKVFVGDNVDIAPHVVITTGGHLIGNEIRRAGNGIINSVSISDGCWIGTNATIVNNTYIGKGCVIAAGSVVVKSSSANKLLAGIPARIKKNLSV